MEPFITFQTNIIWNGVQVRIQIMHHLARGLRESIQWYQAHLQVLLQFWGSIPLLGNLRRMVASSNPGEPPLAQTQNLHNSIECVWETVNLPLQDILRAECYTDVPYAPALELGGAIQIDQDGKTHTSWRLSHPIRKAITILPRPSWIPVFNREVRRMVQIIRNGGY